MNQIEKDAIIKKLDENIEFFAKRFRESRNARIITNIFLGVLDEKIYKELGTERVVKEENDDVLEASLILSFCCVINIEMLMIRKHLLLSTHEW